MKKSNFQIEGKQATSLAVIVAQNACELEEIPFT